MTLLAPMLPQLGVLDASRSIAFYRDLLGFRLNWAFPSLESPGVAEFEFGAAKIQVGRHDGVRDNHEQWSARKATLLFFETDDVEAFHAVVTAKGGEPTEIKLVEYWMKMRFFEVVDPDGHAIWIGQRA